MAEKIDGLKFLKSLSDSSKKIAEQQYAKDLTKKKREKQIALETKKFEEAQKKEAETGAEAETRLLSELKKARGSIATTSGEPLYPSDFPPVNRARDVRGNKDAMSMYMSSADYIDDTKGSPGTPTRIAKDRMDQIRKDLTISQQATKKGISFKNAQRQSMIEKDINNKAEELSKVFFRPGVDPKKAEYLTRLALEEYVEKKYGK
tara:strand:+ start:1360 stop:1974 length:615 start_codon:yes stop_codon:yes gene_type:complete